MRMRSCNKNLFKLQQSPRMPVLRESVTLIFTSRRFFSRSQNEFSRKRAKLVLIFRFSLARLGKQQIFLSSPSTALRFSESEPRTTAFSAFPDASTEKRTRNIFVLRFSSHLVSDFTRTSCVFCCSVSRRRWRKEK